MCRLVVFNCQASMEICVIHSLLPKFATKLPWPWLWPFLTLFDLWMSFAPAHCVQLYRIRYLSCVTLPSWKLIYRVSWKLTHSRPFWKWRHSSENPTGGILIFIEMEYYNLVELKTAKSRNGLFFPGLSWFGRTVASFKEWNKGDSPFLYTLVTYSLLCEWSLNNICYFC